MMSSTNKPELSTLGVESDVQSLSIQPLAQKIHIIDCIRIGLSAMALCCAILVLVTSGHTLLIYNWTKPPADFLIPIWPDNFDVRPTVALVAGSSVIILTNIVSFACCKVLSLHTKMIHISVNFAAPLVGLITTIVVMTLFYAVNASETADTMQSWSCRWEAVVMILPPHFSTICKEAKTGLFLSIVLIPIETIVLCVTGWQFLIEKQALSYGFFVRKGTHIP